MADDSSLYLKCRQFFVGYPLAIRPAAKNTAAHSMILVLAGADEVTSFVLVQNGGPAEPSYSIRRWPAGDAVLIGAGGDAGVPSIFVQALTCGVPMPRHGSLFGSRDGEYVTALLAIYAHYAEASPHPGWSLMPRAEIPRAQWPQFAHEHRFGSWFWEHHRAGGIVSLDGLIAQTVDAVFWAETAAALGSGCCVVARDIRSPDGYTLPRGRYIHHVVLQADKPVPSLQTLLASVAKTDLAGRFC
jgi:hypothetical protein